MQILRGDLLWSPLKICVGEAKKTALRLHHLDKAEHFVRTFIGITFVCIGHLVVGCKILTPKLVDLKTALVDVKMNIALLKIGRAGLPNLSLGVQSLNRLPCTVANAPGVLLGGDEQDLQLVVVSFFVNFQDHTSNPSAIQNNAVGLAIGRVDTTLDGFSRDDFTVKIKMVVALAEFLDRSVLERPLIIENKLLTVIICEGNERNFCVFHNYLQNKDRASAIAKQ